MFHLEKIFCVRHAPSSSALLREKELALQAERDVSLAALKHSSGSGGRLAAM